MYTKKNSLIMGLLALAMILIVSCATMFTKGGGDYRAGENAYKSNDFVSAAEFAVNAVKANSEFPEAIDLVKRAFPKGTEALESEIQKLKDSDNPFKYEDIAPLYARLKTLHDGAKELSVELTVKDYSAELEEAEEESLNGRYQYAVDLLKQGGFQNAREAERHLDIVRQKSPQYKHINWYIGEASKNSKAKACIYVANDLGNLANTIRTSFMSNQNYARKTEIVATSTLGLQNNVSVAEATKRAREKGIDLLVYITGEIKSDSQGLRLAQKQIFTGIPGAEMTASYTATVNGNWQVIDVFNDKVRVQNNYSTSFGEKLSVNVLTPSKNQSITRGGLSGNKTVGVLDVEENSLNIASAALRAILSTHQFRENSSFKNPKTFETMSFNEITKLLDGKMIYNNVYFLKNQEGVLDIASLDESMTWQTLESIVTTHRTIYQNITNNVNKNLTANMSSARNSVLSSVASALQRPIASALLK